MDGIIFDVDGTLWDSTDIVAYSWNKIITENTGINPHITGDGLKSLFGKTMDELTSALLPSLSKEERTRIGHLCFDHENAFLASHPGTLYPGVREVFESLSQETDLFIVSNCQSGYIEVLLQTCNLEKYIKDYLCFGETQAAKNETIRLLMERNHLEEVVYVGDTQGDFDACQKAGVPFVLAEYGFGDVPDALMRIQTMEELPDLLHKKGFLKSL